MSTIHTHVFSDEDMQCPGSYYGGFKDGRGSFGNAERSLSNEVTGDPVLSTFEFDVNDYDRLIREELASQTNRYWTEALTIRMVSRAERAILGRPYTVFTGPIIDAQPDGLTWHVTLGDIVARSLLSDQNQIPWRQIKDGPLSELIEISDTLDREAPEPIIYGEHLRVPEVDPASPQGFIYTPTLLGTIDVGGDAWWVWLVCGHACKDILDAYVIDPTIGPSPSSIITDEGTKWLIPHHAGHDTQFGAPYQDLRSDTYGNDRRYTRVYGKVGEADPDACAAGTKILALAIQGIERVGDSTGELIVDRIEQYKDFAINHLANFGPASYQSGLRLSNPTWDTLEGLVEIVEESSFDICSAIAAERLPAVGSPATPGYIGAAIIGAHAGDRSSALKWIADWNRSCDVRSTFTHHGQFRVVMMHPTQAIKDAAPLLTDVNEILKDSFGTAVGWDIQATRVPFVGDYEHTTGRWMTGDVAEAEQATVDYNRVIPAERREYPFAPGITALYHLARMAVLRLQHPPRTIRAETEVGADPNGDSLAYLDQGDYVRYRHFASVSESAGSIRLAQIVKHQVQAGARKVRIEAIDCDDLIDYDLPLAETAGSPSVTNDTCADAIDMADLSVPYEATFDTTGNGTDGATTGFGGSNVAYHAAWFKMTGNIFDGVATFSSVGSDYDTQIAVFSGSCGALVQQGYNDNFGALRTSVLDVSIVGGTDYFVLVAGYGPDDAGFLHVFNTFTPA